MGVAVKVTPIYGSHTNQHPLATLLTVDDFNILLDCGWSSPFDPEYLQNLAKLAPSVNAVLISHPDLTHVAALPYAIAHFNLNAPVFATLPVWRMAQMFMYDAYVSLRAQSHFDLFNLDHVDTAFELATETQSAAFHLLKYQQHFPLDSIPGASGIAITPHPAGHLLGGTVWSITKHSENIIYAVHLNHRRERHLNPTTLPSFTRPSHLILSATNSTTHSDNVKPSQVVDHIRNALSNNGNVLIPIDTAGRVIELAAHLHEAWKLDSRLARTPLVILHELASRTFDFARSMIEWMSDEVVRRFDISRENLFLFKHIKLCQSIKDLDSLPSPMVVLASSVSMEIGFSRVLFARWCNNPANAVILVDRPEPDTLYSRVYEHALRMKQQDGRQMPPLKLQVTMRGKEFLQGAELEQWREEERIKKAIEEEEQRQKEEQARLEKEAADREKEQAQQATTEQNAEQQQHPASNQLKAPSETEEEAEERYDRMVLAQLRALRGVPAGTVVETFPFKERTHPAWDEYGQDIDTTRFMIGEDPGEGVPKLMTEELNGQHTDMNNQEALQEEIPTKYVEETTELVVSCQTAIVDCSGLSDGDSLKRLVKEVEPRHVTLIAGSTEETAHLEQYLLSNLYVADKALPAKEAQDMSIVNSASVVATPKEMELVDITSHTSVHEFMLQDTLVDDLKWNQVNLSSIAFLDAMVSEESDESGKQVLSRSAIISATSKDDMDIDSPAPKTLTFEKDVSQESEGHPTVFVGTIMMNTLKDKLSQAGVKAEFAGGALCVENPETKAVVLIKKVGAQQIVIEGSFSEEYLIVKDLVYDELVIPQ